MRKVDLYISTLEQVLEGEGDKTLIIDADQVQIFNFLNQRDAIALVNMKPTEADPSIKSSEPVVAYEVRFGVLQRDALTEELASFRTWSDKNINFLADTNEGEATLLLRGDGFVYYGNGLITYKDKIVEMPPQSATVFGLLMEHYRHHVTADSILERAGIVADSMDGLQKAKRASKIIWEIKELLQNLIGHNPINSQARRGWVLDFKPKE